MCEAFERVLGICTTCKMPEKRVRFCGRSWFLKLSLLPTFSFEGAILISHIRKQSLEEESEIRRLNQGLMQPGHPLWVTEDTWLSVMDKAFPVVVVQTLVSPLTQGQHRGNAPPDCLCELKVQVWLQQKMNRMEKWLGGWVLVQVWGYEFKSPEPTYKKSGCGHTCTVTPALWRDRDRVVGASWPSACQGQWETLSEKNEMRVVEQDA